MKGYAMSIGKAERDIALKMDQSQAYEAFATALRRVGRVTESDEPAFLRGRTRVGLQRVDFNIWINAAEDGSTARVEAFADDIWGGGARLGIRKLMKALDGNGSL
jgi:hypothetical protein